MEKRYLFLAIAFVFMLIEPSCVEDKCTGVVCENRGLCVDGICTCPSGYEGVKCTDIWHTKFSGNWSAAEHYKNDSNVHIYDMQLAGGGRADTFIVYNFLDSVELTCYRTGMYTFGIRSRKEEGVTINSGFGVMNTNGSKITGVYNSSVGSVTYNTDFSWTK
jgi:hypothetical protein